jgi:hypothetical protein
MAIIKNPVGFEQEEILIFPGAGPPMSTVAVSGYAVFHKAFAATTDGPTIDEYGLVGDEDDDGVFVKYRAEMVVGPTFSQVQDVSPVVTVAGYTFFDSDTADHSGFQVDGCTWDTVGLPPPEQAFERTRLKVELRVSGGSSCAVTRLAYHFIVQGRGLRLE